MGASGSRPTVGWRILKIMPNSPCSQKGLVAYFDVLTHVNGVPLGTTEDQLVDLIKDGVETKLTIYHYVTDSVREVTVTPRRGWGGDGLLGLIIRYSHFDNADQDTIHVLEVHPNSPAAKAGLISHQDYLLGTSKLTFKGYDQLDYFLNQYNDKPGELFVFNAEQYQVREVIITPSANWGGKGSLGCDVGAGYLHRLPLDTTRAVTQLGEGPMTPFISTGTAVQHGHAHAHATHAHGDHGHSHGGNDHGHSHGGNECGHAHGSHDDHGHAHGSHQDHGHAHGSHGDLGHAHGAHQDHGHAHGAHDDHGHAHGLHNDHGHAHGDHGHSHGGNDHGHAHHAPAPVAAPSTISYATPAQPTGTQGQYSQPPPQQQQQQQQQQQHQAQYQSQAQYSFAGQPISSYSDSSTAPGLFTQEMYANQVTDPRFQPAFAGQAKYAGQYVPTTGATPAPAAAAGAGAGLSVQAPFNTQYPPQQFGGTPSYPAHPAYLQQAPNQQPYIIQPANVPPMQSQVKLEPSASSLP